MTTQINPEKVAQLDALILDHGSHPSFEAGHCAMEVVSWLADEGHTDVPACASPVLRDYVIGLNDRWDDEKRQALKPYLIRMIGTGADGKDPIRRRIAAEWITERLLPDWLRLAGMDEQIAALDAVEPGNSSQLRSTLYAVRTAALDLRASRRQVIKDKVREELAKRPAAGAAGAADVADAAAAVAAAAVAERDAYSAAYWAARPIFEQAYRDSDVFAQIRALGEEQAPQALELLDLLIDAEEVSA